MTTMEPKNRTMNGVSEESEDNFVKEVLVLEEKFTDVDGELFEGTAELRKRKREGKEKPEERRFSDTPRVGLDWSSEGEAGLTGTTGRRCTKEFGVALKQRRTSEGDQSSVSSAGRTQRRKAVVRKRVG